MMKQMVGLFLTVLLGVPMIQAPAEANGRVVIVEAHVTRRFQPLVRQAVRFVDRYTGSKVVVGKCRKGVRCITVIFDSERSFGGTTSWYGKKTYEGDAKITFNGDNRYSNAQMTRLIEHELGHAFGLSHYGGKQCNLMRPVVDCGHRVPPEYFNESQRQILKKW